MRVAAISPVGPEPMIATEGSEGEECMARLYNNAPD